MTGKQHRRSVADRARRRAIRAHAEMLGVPYSVAARLLTAQTAPPSGLRRRGFPTGADKHREWLFAMREQRTFALRLRDTRLAAELPLGRAAHLAERFPPLRTAEALYHGEMRQATLAMLYTVLAHESPAQLPATEELTWAAELGEETGVDIVCAWLDRAARLLLDEDPWRLCLRIESALIAFQTGSDRSLRDVAKQLSPEFRTFVPRKSLPCARNILDALLVAAYDGHPPGAEVRILAGRWEGQTATVIGAGWQRQGPPTHYEVRNDTSATVMILDARVVDSPDEPLHAIGGKLPGL
jgi:hypothetical protein